MSRVGKRVNKQLIAQMEAGVRPDGLVVSQPNAQLPEQVSREFCEDAVQLAYMHGAGGVACTVHGMEWQEAMAEKYPADWMLWLLQAVGYYTY